MPSKEGRSILLLAGCGMLLASAARAGLSPEQVNALPPPAARQVDFAREVKPIFEGSCVKCHARGQSKGGFQMETRAGLLAGGDSGPAVAPGKSQDSFLIELVAGLNPESVMPRNGSRLSREQIGVLRAWIDQGAAWDAAISFAKPPPGNLFPRRPEVPAPHPANLRTNPVDRFLETYFETNGVAWLPPVKDRVFARRVCLDVIGLLPSPDLLDTFEADTRPDKRQRLVRQLLDDRPGYAAHWLTFWNDLLRNDYRGTGYIDGGRKQISGWLYQALVQNLPYDQFTAQLLNPTPESEGFVKGIVWRGAVNASQIPPMQAAQNIAQVFMGVNLKCASCHDSFINDWRLADAYGLAAIYSDTPLEIFKCDQPTGKQAVLRFLYPELGQIDAQAPKAERLKQFASLLTGRKDGRFSRTIINRLWAKFFGLGLVEPLDDMERPAWRQDLLDWLAEDLADNGWDMQHSIELMLTSAAYALPAAPAREPNAKGYVFRGPLPRRMSAEQFRDALGSLTGVWYAEPAGGIQFGAQTNHAAALAAMRDRVRASLVAADPLLVALGRPSREQVTTSRADAATTLQALELTNGQTLARVLRQAAVQLLASAPQQTPRDLVTRLYQRGLGRTPTPAELDLATELLPAPPRPADVEDVVWSLVMLPEFQIIY